MTAKQKLKQITAKELWYKGAFKESTAHSYKNRLRNNKLTDEKVREILHKLNIKPKQEEVW